MKTPVFLTCAILLLASCMPLQAGTRITPSPAPSSTKFVIVTDSHKNDKKHKKHKKAKKDKKEKTVVIKVGTKVKKRPANAVVIKYDKRLLVRQRRVLHRVFPIRLRSHPPARRHDRSGSSPLCRESNHQRRTVLQI